ncbi:MAG TPA: toll/interleukin-1 receptor domain-containing protein [Nitrospira sp.]|nr:toll/interleukin-1 receptor domain-containing protein [Nitrospira sp.]
MPSVFVSYSRADLRLIEQLEARLKDHPEISIWRDQDKIYGGQKWPKVLGEAIADQDVFLLTWSRNSAASHFVELDIPRSSLRGWPLLPRSLRN